MNPDPPMQLEHRCRRLTCYFESGSFDFNDESPFSSWESTCAHVRGLGLSLPVAHAILFDTLAQHGEGDDKDSFGDLVCRCGPRSSLEEVWLEKFLAVRFKVLFHPHDGHRSRLWPPSVKRVCALQLLLRKYPQLDHRHEYERAIADAF